MSIFLKHTEITDAQSDIILRTARELLLKVAARSTDLSGRIGIKDFVVPMSVTDRKRSLYFADYTHEALTKLSSLVATMMEPS